LVPALFARKGVALRPVFLAGLFYCGKIKFMEFTFRIAGRSQASLPIGSGALRLVISSLALFLICFPATCTTAFGAQTAASRTFTDEVGRQVKVPAAVKRIVSLAPNITEIIYALGESNRLAGDTDFCDYPAAAALKPHVGGVLNPNLEQIAALTPDLVLATKSINRPETVEALARIGLPVFVTDPHSVDQMIVSVEHIGDVLHAEKKAAPQASDLRGRLASLDIRLAGVAPSRVLFVIWTNPLISVGRNTFLADALRHAGARSVVDTAVEWPRVSLEEIVHLQPEFLIFASSHDKDTQHDIDALRGRPGWRDLDAMRKDKIIVISDAINRPAPRMVDAVEQLARALHPDSFSNGEIRGDDTHILEEACACAR
jgi:cobalamin transport system substrate-binding protein